MNITIGDPYSFLSEVYVLDFGDDYHRSEDQASSELEKAAKRIRRRYKNISDYMHAMGIYNEYMAYLIRKHGGPELFKIKYKADEINEFVPARPRMKNNPVNKALLKNRIMISKVNINKINEDVLESIDETIADPAFTEIVVDEDARNRGGEKLLEDINMDNDTQKLKEISNVDYLEEYFKTKNIVLKSRAEKEKKKYSVTDLMNGDVYEKIQDTSEDDDVINYRGEYMRQKEAEELQVYKDLSKLGWDHIKIMRTMGVSKRVTDILKDQEKDKKKKGKDKKNKKESDDDFFVHIVTDGGYDSYADFEKDMLNMTSGNVFK